MTDSAMTDSQDLPFEEATLVERLRSGDAAAYTQWVSDESPRAMATARRILRDEAAAEDAVQDAFLCAFRSLSKFEGGARLSTWFHRIVVNCALLGLRRRRRRSLESLDADAGEESGSPGELSRGSGSSNEFTDAAEHNELCRVIEDSYRRLPESYRTVIRLRDLEGLDTSSTARALGIGSDAVKMRIHRARHALRASIDAYMLHGEPSLVPSVAG